MFLFTRFRWNFFGFLFNVELVTVGRDVLVFDVFFDLSSSSSLFASTLPCWMLRCQFSWIFSDELDVIIDGNSLIFSDINEEFLGMRSDLSTRSCTNELFNFLPVFAVISKTYIIRTIPLVDIFIYLVFKFELIYGINIKIE